MKKIAFALLLVLLFTASACVPAGNQNAQPISTPALTMAAAILDTPTPEPTINPAIKAALGDPARNYYSVAPDGNATIIEKGTNQDIVIEIVKAVDVKTNDGLAKDIKTGYDKDGNRFVYVENFGWVKDIDPGTPEKRTQVPYEWFGNGTINTIAALHYQDHPTIPPGAINPQWWLRGEGSKEINGYLGILSIISSVITDAAFTKSSEPYGTQTLWLEFNKNDKGFVTVIQPNKNPSFDNQKQLINLNLTFDKDRFDATGKNVDKLVDLLIKDKMYFQILIAPDSSRLQVFNRSTNLMGPDGVFHTPELQKPGELLNLFTPEEQAAIETVWQKESKVAWGRIPESERDVKINVLPQQLALKPLTADYTSFPWGNIQP